MSALTIAVLRCGISHRRGEQCNAPGCVARVRRSDRPVHPVAAGAQWWRGYRSINYVTPVKVEPNMGAGFQRSKVCASPFTFERIVP